MKTFCVDSHHRIGTRPLEEQGVLLMPPMLKNGVWYPSGGSSSSSSDKEYRAEVNMHRSEAEQEYLLLLEVLVEMSANPDDLVAAISLMWDTRFNRFWIPKRVWMSICLGEKVIACYSHLPDGGPTRSILELYEKPVFDKDVWRKRFAQDIKDGIQSQAA